MNHDAGDDVLDEVLLLAGWVEASDGLCEDAEAVLGHRVEGLREILS